MFNHCLTTFLISPQTNATNDIFWAGIGMDGGKRESSRGSDSVRKQYESWLKTFGSSKTYIFI